VAGSALSNVIAGTTVAPGTSMDRTLARLQGLYFLATGVWPLVSMRTFEAVTGPKVDRWLVKTVGVLVSVIGGSLVLGARRPAPPPTVLAVGSAAGLGAIDVIYAAKGRISRVYLLDAVLEAVIVGAWALSAVTAARRTVYGPSGRWSCSAAATASPSSRSAAGPPASPSARCS
jgi:hypothetical protein